MFTERHHFCGDCFSWWSWFLVVEIRPTSQRGPDELWAESAKKVLPEVLLGSARKSAPRPFFFLAFRELFGSFGSFSGTPNQVPKSTSGSTFSALSAQSSSGPLWLIGRILVPYRSPRVGGVLNVDMLWGRIRPRQVTEKCNFQTTPSYGFGRYGFAFSGKN